MSNETTILDAGLLARVERQDWAETLREDLEDCLKEYSQLDVVVEVLQNALDAIDYKRYSLICNAARLKPDDNQTHSDRRQPGRCWCHHTGQCYWCRTGSRLCPRRWRAQGPAA